jgi:hypothetical protein
LDFAQRRETALAIIVLLLSAALPLMPLMAQDQDYHHFADSRAYLGMPNALDTLSNLPFVIAGLAGLVLLASGRLRTPGPAASAAVTVFFLGFIATGAGSAWYHHSPNDTGLALDRYGMVIAFAGALGTAAACKVSQRAGWAMLALALVAGPGSVAWWVHTGNLAPYAVLQFGGMLLLAATLFWRADVSGPNWAALMAAYAIAKGCEAADFQIFELTGHLISGHSLKRLVAACAALAVITPALRVAKPAPDSQNGGLSARRFRLFFGNIKDQRLPSKPRLYRSFPK